MIEVFLLCSAILAAAPPQLSTPAGPLIGTQLPSGVQRFGNIPFAEPPLGALRFARAKLAALGASLDATGLGSPCIQNPLGDPRDSSAIAAGVGPPTEDCLRLNIWVPPGVALANATDLPVMVWIFGGGLCGGFASDGYYSGERMAAQQGVVVVSVSYRLGALGFLPFDNGAFDGGGSGGMNGMHDVVVALEWVRANIAHFGGAAKDVTLFGQSSGSYLICNLCVAPRANGLFSRAALHSGPCLGGPPGQGWGPSNASLARKVRADVFTALGASTLAELRAIKNASTIQWPAHYMNDLDAAPYFAGYFPDDYVVPSASGGPGALWQRGAINPAALLIGHTTKDGTAGFYGIAPTLGLVPGDVNQSGAVAYEAAQRAVWGGDSALADKVLAAYPITSGAYGGSGQSAFIQSDADVFVICPAYALSSAAHSAGRDVWHFEFAHFQYSPNALHMGGRGWGCDAGVELDLVPAAHVAESKQWATHGAETHYVFGTETGPDPLGPPNNLTHCEFGAAEKALSATMMAYWANFAKHGDPNGVELLEGGRAGAKLPLWPQYGAAQTTQRLVDGAVDGEAIGPKNALHDAECKFWSSVYPY